MPDKKGALKPVSRPGIVVLGAVYFLYLSVVLRTFANANIHPQLPVYLALEFIFLVFASLVLWRPARQPLWHHLYFIFQSMLVLTLVLLRPRFDFIVVLYVILSLQAVLVFSYRSRWIWVTLLALLTGIPLMITLGALQGLSLALMPMTIGIVFAAYVVVTQDIETGLRNRQALLAKLQAAHEQLMVSASQVEELSVIEERNRLARALHDSVSQTMFSIRLHIRASQIMLEREPERLRSQLELLQTLAQSALEQMRSLITHMRPSGNESALRTKTQDPA